MCGEIARAKLEFNVNVFGFGIPVDLPSLAIRELLPDLIYKKAALHVW